MNPKSTTENSLTWKIWHGVNYIIGGVSFIFGSFALFPFLAPYINTAAVSAWFYTVGSLAFLLADLTEWLHFTSINCPFLWLSINFFASLTGSTFYLIGSIAFLPMINKTDLGNLFFIIGSAFIFLSQFWKIVRTLSEEGKSMSQCYEEDVAGFHVDLHAGLGGLMYFIGTFILEKAANDSDYTVPGVIIYCLGGIFFTVSGIFLNYRYFLREKNGYSLAKTSV